jgi:hypothetical protein
LRGFLFGYETGAVGGALPLIGRSLHIGDLGKSWVTGRYCSVPLRCLDGQLADLISPQVDKVCEGHDIYRGRFGARLLP